MDWARLICLIRRASRGSRLAQPFLVHWRAKSEHVSMGHAAAFVQSKIAETQELGRSGYSFPVSTYLAQRVKNNPQFQHQGVVPVNSILRKGNQNPILAGEGSQSLLALRRVLRTFLVGKALLPRLNPGLFFVRNMRINLPNIARTQEW